MREEKEGESEVKESEEQTEKKEEKKEEEQVNQQETSVLSALKLKKMKMVVCHVTLLDGSQFSCEVEVGHICLSDSAHEHVKVIVLYNQ